MNRSILKLAIPNILSNISVPLLSTVDVALMGGLSVLHLGAIGLATIIFNFLFWNFGFLRMGTTGLVAQAHGRDDNRLINSILSQGAYLSLFIAALIIVFQLVLGNAAIVALSIGESHQPLVWEYFNIRIWSAPASLLTYTLVGWLFGRQNSLIPMITTILVNVVNIIISYYLVIHAEAGIQGVAFGTVIAEYLGVVVLFCSVRLKYNARFLPIGQLSDWTRYFRINRDLFIRTLALTLAFAFFYRESSQAGALILATNVVILQFLSWLSYGIDGFAFASESIVGMHSGKGDLVKVRKAISLSFLWGIGIALSFSLIYGTFTIQIGGVFSDDTDVLELLMLNKWWLAVLPILAFPAYVWDGIFIGLTRTVEMRNSMIVSFIFFIAIYYFIHPYFSNGIWVTFVSFLAIRGILLSGQFFGKISRPEFLLQDSGD